MSRADCLCLDLVGTRGPGDTGMPTSLAPAPSLRSLQLERNWGDFLLAQWSLIQIFLLSPQSRAVWVSGWLGGQQVPRGVVAAGQVLSTPMLCSWSVGWEIRGVGDKSRLCW